MDICCWATSCCCCKTVERRAESSSRRVLISAGEISAFELLVDAPLPSLVAWVRLGAKEETWQGKQMRFGMLRFHTFSRLGAD